MSPEEKKRIIPVGDFKIAEEEKNAINDVLDSNHITEGAKLKEFEENFADYVGTKYAVGVNSGTSALICGLLAFKNNKKIADERRKIITTPLTYTSTSNAIVLSNFEPIYVDIDENTFCITAENIAEHLENIDDVEEYSLILPVHLLGYPCEMNKINKIAKKYNLETFEDSAEAHGTILNGKKTGSMSLLSAFSFYIAHNIQVGEMGAITTNNFELVKLIRKLKANGRMCDCIKCTRSTSGCPKIQNYSREDSFDPRFKHDLIGYNFKTMDFQAALGIIQLKKAKWIIKTRYENVKYLNEELEEFENLLKLPKLDKNVSYISYPLVNKDPNKLNLFNIRKDLEKFGIETRPLFGCIPTQQPAYSYLKYIYINKLPVAEYTGSNGFYMGCHQYLSVEDLEYIIKIFKRVLK